MANDRGWVPGSEGRASAGHNADTGSCEAGEQGGQEMDVLGQPAGYSGQWLLTGSGGERSNERVGWEQRSHSNGPSRSDGAGHAAGSGG